MCFTTIKEAILWLENLTHISPPPCKDIDKHNTIKSLLFLCGNPEKKIKLIHIAGSKGKSSAAKVVSVFIEKLGHTVGLFTSPHISSYNERIQINNSPINDASFLLFIRKMYNLIKKQKRLEPTFTPTFFEVITCIGFLAFKHAQCQWAVIETGIGGRLDTTNIINPEFCIITEIEKEHTDILGKALPHIAYEKAGIIKPNTPVWIGKQNHAITIDVFEATAHKMRSPCFLFQKQYKIHNYKCTMDGSSALCTSGDHTTHFHTPSMGKGITESQILAYTAFQDYFSIPLQKSILFPKNVILPARCEIVSISKTSSHIFLDGAHTYNSIKNSLEIIKTMPKEKCLLFAMLKNKDYISICSLMKPYMPLFSNVIITHAHIIKSLPPSILYSEVKKIYPRALLIEDTYAAFKHACNIGKNTNTPPHTYVCIIGSLYLCAFCKTIINKNITI